MTTLQEPTSTHRVFKYGGKVFPDPGAAYTAQQVLDHIKNFFPELGNATIDEKQGEDGTLEITFSKQVTTKG